VLLAGRVAGGACISMHARLRGDCVIDFVTTQHKDMGQMYLGYPLVWCVDLLAEHHAKWRGACVHRFFGAHCMAHLKKEGHMYFDKPALLQTQTLLHA
jgi:hypothetical protein